ncbi:MAG: cytochrome c5 family protein [Rhodanobacteraceae bacterium]|nr:cytochrome c5 family protein [Rhodanobacteraceae bacterium]
MKALAVALLTALALAACKPQDPAPLPPQVGTRTTPAPQPAAPADATTPVASGDAATAPADATAASADAAATPAPAVAAVDGEAVYQKACIACHGTGVAGAPKLGDAADWGPRVAQGEALLFEHATKGFTGKKGMMPPKGGFMALSDDEIHAAIAYMTAAPAP